IYLRLDREINQFSGAHLEIGREADADRQTELDADKLDGGEQDRGDGFELVAELDDFSRAGLRAETAGADLDLRAQTGLAQNRRLQIADDTNRIFSGNRDDRFTGGDGFTGAAVDHVHRALERGAKDDRAELGL